MKYSAPNNIDKVNVDIGATDLVTDRVSHLLVFVKNSLLTYGHDLSSVLIFGIDLRTRKREEGEMGRFRGSRLTPGVVSSVRRRSGHGTCMRSPSLRVLRVRGAVEVEGIVSCVLRAGLDLQSLGRG